MLLYPREHIEVICPRQHAEPFIEAAGRVLDSVLGVGLHLELQVGRFGAAHHVGLGPGLDVDGGGVGLVVGVRLQAVVDGGGESVDRLCKLVDDILRKR